MIVPVLRPAPQVLPFQPSWIDKIAYGSTEVGKDLSSGRCREFQNASRWNRVARLANIIFEDAPLDQAVEGVINGIFFNQGHVCRAGSRLYVTGIGSPRSHPQTGKTGWNPDRRRSDGQEYRYRGHHRAQLLQTINRYLGKSGRKKERKCTRAAGSLPAKGFWCRPTIFTQVAQSNRIACRKKFSTGTYRPYLPDR